jgi:hypothetical protein
MDLECLVLMILPTAVAVGLVLAFAPPRLEHADAKDKRQLARLLRHLDDDGPREEGGKVQEDETSMSLVGP